MNEQDHLFTIAMEECAELAQRISKAARFGMDEVQPDAVANPERWTNRERIYREYYDLRALLGMIGIDAWTTSLDSASAERRKVLKVHEFLAYSRQQGRLDGPSTEA